MAIETLFGPSIADVQELRRLQAEKEIAGAGREFGVFAPLYQASLRFGNQAVQGANTLLGAQDPMLKKATDIQGILTQYQGQDLTDAGILKKISSDLAGKGYAAESLSLAQEAQQAATKQAALRKAELSDAQELKLRQELAALGPTASEDQVLAVVTKYGSPDKIMAALSAKQSREAQREQQRDIAQQRLDIQRQNLEFKKDLQSTKVQAQSEKQAQAAEQSINNLKRVITSVGEAEGLVGKSTTGALGGALAILPQTDARKLANKITSIKANLGFQQLDQMRQASPTGGALGNVSNQEISFLQATVEVLDQLENPEDIRQAFVKIKEHLSNWKETLEGRLPAKYQAGGGQGAVPTAPTTAPASTSGFKIIGVK